jgi:exodeoxyribonuclease VII large subunit
MSDDQLSWKKLLADEASKADAKTHAKAQAQGQTRAKTPRTPITEKSEVSFSKMDWSPLGKPTEPNVAPKSVLVTKESTRVKVEKTAAKTTVVQSVSTEVSELEVQEDEQPQVFSVYDLNKQIKNILEGRFPIVWVKGEISNFKAHTSGHHYFSLKDSKAQISAVMFKGFNGTLKFRPEDGMEVIVRGRVTVYEPRGNYQIFCESMEPVGAGALQKAFEQLKAKLQAEGLFDQARKRPLPTLPKHIAIVTSPTGAAIRDMLNVLGRRFKGAKVTLIPARVQGTGAAEEICAAIALANKIKDVDVMIVGRGGGSIEDMWCFNEESVARAIAAARVPVISAVGHEIDFTIADFVADLRAPTPSAAAELVVKSAAELQNRIATDVRSLKLCIAKKLELKKHRVEQFTKRLVDPQRKIEDAMLRCDELTQRLETLFMRGLDDRRLPLEHIAQRMSSSWTRYKERKQSEIEKMMALLDSLSPLKVVARGYSVVTVNNKLINDVAQVKKGDIVQVQFARGTASAKIEEIKNNKAVLDQE